MVFPVMQPDTQAIADPTVHQRYRRLLRAGFTANESAALIAVADGIARHSEGDEPALTPWRWQEIGRIEFMAYLASHGRLGGPMDGQPEQR
jgi:cytochrome P450